MSAKEPITKDTLLTRLRDLHAPVRVPGLGEYQYACGEAALELERLSGELIKAQQFAMRQGNTIRRLEKAKQEHEVSCNG